MWQTSPTYKQVLQQESQFELYNHARRVWEVDQLPYKIIIPGVKHTRSSEEHAIRYLEVKLPDTWAALNTQMFLAKLGAQAKIETMRVPYHQEWYDDHIRDFAGHLVFICSRTLIPEFREHLKESGFPYEIVSNDDVDTADIIREVKTGNSYPSPMDINKEDPFSDYCFIGKYDRPIEEQGKCFLIIGIHTLGTFGGSIFFTDFQRLKSIEEKVLEKVGSPHSNFAQLLRCRSVLGQLDDTDAEPWGDPVIMPAAT